MFRYVLPVLAALVLITASLIPDDAFARGRGGGGYRGGGGFHGGAVRAGGVHRGGVYAGRVGAGRVGYRGGYYPRRGYGAAAVGAAAVGAAAYGAYGAYNNCYDAYGNYICNQYRYGYGRADLRIRTTNGWRRSDQSLRRSAISRSCELQ